MFSTAVGHRCFLDSSSVVAMEVRFVASGERLLTLEPGELEQKTAQDLKRLVAPLVGVSRFRQRLYRACDGCEIGDEEVFLEGRIVLLVVLPFVSDDFEKMKMMMKAVEEDDLVALEGTLSCPCDPNFVYEEESGVSVRMPNGTFLPTRQRGAPLQSAASLGLGGAVRLLLEAGARCDSLLDHLWTPLRGAVSGNHFHVVEMLLQAGADADFYNPLFLAAQKGYLRCAELLLESGAALDQGGVSWDTMEEGRTPLMVAAYAGHLDMVRLLLARGARCDIADRNQKTAMDHAAMASNVAMVQCLVKPTIEHFDEPVGEALRKRRRKWFSRCQVDGCV